MKISSIDKNIKSVLGSLYYKIPRFQRPYSWDKENITDFWDDTIVNDEAEYFIGSMVVYKIDRDNYGIVDGQQRLTTITIILASIRNALKEEGLDDLAQGIQLLIERKTISNDTQFVLSTESSFPFFQKKVLSFSEEDIDVEIGDEEKNIEDSFNLITSNITEIIESIKMDTTLSDKKQIALIKDKLLSIRDKILNLNLIFIELDNEDDAYLIFETLNTRGKDLSVSDLVKNHLTKLIPTKNKNYDPPKIQWGEMMAILEDSSEDLSVDTFLHHFWLSQYEYVTIKKLFKVIKKKVHKANALEYLKTLLEDVKTYREINEPSYRKWNKEERQIKKSLAALNIFRVKQQIPMTLSLMRDYKQKNITKKELSIALKKIEHFHFKFTAVTSQRSSGGISQMYASTARRFTGATTKKTKRDILKEFYGKMDAKIPKYEEFKINFNEILFSEKSTKSRKLVRYMLENINEKFNTNSQNIDYNSLSIEHLYPQNPKTSKKISETIYGKIGNLLFIDSNLNNRLQNKSFLEKKKILEEHHYPFDNILKKSKVWGEKEINKRTDFLADTAYKTIWK